MNLSAILFALALNGAGIDDRIVIQPNVSSMIASARAIAANSAIRIDQGRWQADYDTALAKKASAKKKMLMGVAGSVGGTLLAAMGGASCDFEDAFDDGCENEMDLAWLGYLTSVAGGGVLLWGAIEYFDANGDMNRLNSQKPGGGGGLSLPLGDNIVASISSGPTTSASLSIRW